MIAPPGVVTLIVTDTHPSGSPAAWYTIPITATGGSVTRNVTVGVLVGGVDILLADNTQRLIHCRTVALTTCPIRRYLRPLDLHARRPSSSCLIAGRSAAQVDQPIKPST